MIIFVPQLRVLRQWVGMELHLIHCTGTALRGLWAIIMPSNLRIHYLLQMEIQFNQIQW